MPDRHRPHQVDVSDVGTQQDFALAASVIAHADDAIIAKTVDGQVLSWNAAAERIFGYAADEMIGQSITRLLPEDRIHEEADLIAQVQAGGEISHFETRRLRKDGALIEVAVSLSAIRNADGRIVAVSKIARDITPHKRLQSRAAIAEELQQGLDQSSLKISLWGSNERNLYANRPYAADWDLSPDALLGQHFSDVLEPAHYARAKPRADAARAGQPQVFERQVLSKSGQVGYELVNLIPGKPVGGGSDERRGLFIIITDITLQVRAQQAAAAAAERFKRLYEDTPAMLHATDPNGRLLAVSSNWLKGLGYARDEVLGTDVADYLTPHSRRIWQQARQAIADTGRCDNVPLEAVCRSGRVMDVLMSATLEGDGDGRPLQTLTVLQDVTDRVRAERALSATSARLAAIIDATGAGTWEWHLQTGQTQYSERWAELLGYRLDEVQALGIEARSRATHPDELASSRAVLLRHLKGETEAYECDVRLRRKDGSWLWMRDQGRVTTRSSDGRALTVSGTLEDISDRKAREFRLAQSEAFLKRTGALARVGGWELDLKSDELSWSEQTRLIHGVGPGYRPSLEAAINFYGPQARPVIASAVEACIRDGTPFDLELPLIGATDREIWVRVFGEVEWESGHPVRLIGAFQDITEQRQRRGELVRERQLRSEIEERSRELDQLLRERSEMLDVMAHEVRQPLNNASAALQSAAAELREVGGVGASPVSDRLARAQQVMGAVLASIDNTLAVASLLARPEPIQRVDTDIDTMLQVALMDIPAADRHRVRLDRVTRTHTASMDMGLLRLALRNLLSNALTYSPPGSTVVVRLSDSEEPLALVIDVADEGPGFEQALVPRLFERGVRQAGAAPQAGHGMGLGLFIVRRVMALHGGQAVLVRNSAEGATLRLVVVQTSSD